jgi:26S proteasome regulatory subunit N8
MCQVGVEHLLRDINDPSTSTLALRIHQKVEGLAGLSSRLQEIHAYLTHVTSGKIPINAQISSNLQNILNLLPNLNVDELVKSMLVKSNDIHLALYLSSLVRSILALHSLLSNKLKYKDIDDLSENDVSLLSGKASSNSSEESSRGNAGVSTAKGGKGSNPDSSTSK